MLPFERVRGAVSAAVAEIDERLADTLQLCVLLRMGVEVGPGGFGHLLVGLAVQVKLRVPNGNLRRLLVWLKPSTV